MKHLTVKDLIRKLEKCPQDSKLIIHNNHSYVGGMYYITNIVMWEDAKETQIELESNYKSIAKGWK